MRGKTNERILREGIEGRSECAMTVLEACMYLIIWSFLGWCGEEVYHTVTYGDFTNRGFVNGPVCTIYGFGFTSVIYVLTPFQDNLLILFLASLVLTTGLELVTGWVMEKIFHTKWWDYSDEPLNLGGYVCLKFAILWGLVCTGVLKLIQPMIEGVVTRLSHTVQLTFVIVCFVIYTIDYIVTIVEIRKIQIRLGIASDIAKCMDDIAVFIGEGLHETSLKAKEKSEETKEMLEKTAESLEAKADEFKDGIVEGLTEGKEKFAEGLEEGREKFVGTLSGGKEKLTKELAELKSRYKKMAKRTNWSYHRLTKAFPNLKIEQKFEEKE